MHAEINKFKDLSHRELYSHSKSILKLKIVQIESTIMNRKSKILHKVFSYWLVSLATLFKDATPSNIKLRIVTYWSCQVSSYLTWRGTNCAGSWTNLMIHRYTSLHTCSVLKFCSHLARYQEPDLDFVLRQTYVFTANPSMKPGFP